MKLPIRRRRRTSVVLAAVAAAFATASWSAPGALASSVQEGGRFFADPGEVNSITVTATGSTISFTDSAGVTNASQSCTQVSPNRVDCTGFTGSVGGPGVLARDGDDRVELIGAFQGIAANGGDGNDLIDGSRATATFIPPTLAGSAGDDTVIGGPGPDRLEQVGGQAVEPGTIQPGTIIGLNEAAFGNDRLLGGGGDDIIAATGGADVVEAGEGADTLNTLAPSGIPASLGPEIQDDGVVDNISCGGGPDSVGVGPGDQVAVDCEVVYQFYICPSGGEYCVGAATVTSGSGATAAGALASAAAKKKGKQKVLGKSRKIKAKSGQIGGVIIRMRSERVRSALGNRTQIPATMRFQVDRVRKGKKIGQVKKKVHFKLKR